MITPAHRILLMNWMWYAIFMCMSLAGVLMGIPILSFACLGGALHRVYGWDHQGPGWPFDGLRFDEFPEWKDRP